MYSKSQIDIKSTVNNADGIVYSTRGLCCFSTQFTKGIMQMQTFPKNKC